MVFDYRAYRAYKPYSRVIFRKDSNLCQTTAPPRRSFGAEVIDGVAPGYTPGIQRYYSNYQGEQYQKTAGHGQGRQRDLFGELREPVASDYHRGDSSAEQRRRRYTHNVAAEKPQYLPVGMTLSADRGLLNRLVTNVLRNAVEAVASAPEPRIEVSVSAIGGHPFISIDDNGRGIPPEVMQNLFQPFFTTKPGGSGIGLCLSRQIARLHGGDFTLTSSARGTKALITLP